MITKTVRGRFLHLGKCETIDWYTLIKILYYFFIPYPNEPWTLPSQMNYYDMRIELTHTVPNVDNLSEDKLYYYYLWYRSGETRKSMCRILRDNMTRLGLVKMEQ